MANLIDLGSRRSHFKADAKNIKRRLGQMESDAGTYRDHCQEIVNYITPFRADVTTSQSPGVKKMQFINDSTATHALLLFAAGISSKMANPSIPWFDLKVTDDYLAEDKEARLWLEAMKKIYHNVFNRSNFYSADQEANIDDGAFGTAPMFIGEHPQWGAYFETLSIGEVFIALDCYGQIDTLYRRYQRTARQIMAKWPKTCSRNVRETVEKHPDQLFTLVHAVQPRGNFDVRKYDRLNMPWESVYMEYDSFQILQEGGFRGFPYVVSRYMVASGEIYGRGPGMIALPDVKELQVRKADTTKAGQLRMAPPVILPKDFMGIPIRRVPFGFTFPNIDPAKKMQDMIGSFPVPSDLGWSEQEMEQMRNQIGRTFFSDLMLMAMDKEVTLGEFMEVAQEKMTMLGPFLGRLQTERYNPVFERVFDILWDQGRIPPPPRQLIDSSGNLKYRVEYISPLAKAQKMAASRGIIQATGYLGQAAAVRPEILDILDWDGSGREILQNSGVPEKYILSPEQVQKVREIRLQQQQAQQQAEMMLQVARTIPALSKEAKPGSPIQAINQGLRQGAGSV